MNERADVVTIYDDQSGQWRWRRTAPNGENIAASGEAFDSRSNAIRAAARANADTEVAEFRMDTGNDAATDAQ